MAAASKVASVVVDADGSVFCAENAGVQKSISANMSILKTDITKSPKKNNANLIPTLLKNNLFVKIKKSPVWITAGGKFVSDEV